jgi:hypothetical protein
MLTIAAAACMGAATQVHAQAFTYKDAKYQARYAAEYWKAGQLRTLAILPFSGPDGANFTTALSSELAGTQLSGENWFTIKPASTRETDPLRAGKALDVAGIVTGNVVNAKLTRTDRIDPIDKKSKGDPAATGIPCTRISLQYDVRAQVFDVANGTTAYDKTHSVQDGYDVCNGKGQAIPVETKKGLGIIISDAITGEKKKEAFTVDYTEDALFQRLRKAVADKIIGDIAPYNKEQWVGFKDRAPELPKPLQQTFESAKPFVKAGQLDRACAIWTQLRSEPAAAASVSLLYNLGACQEAQKPDNPIAALELYTKADQLLIKPDKQVAPALKRAQEMVENQQKIGS